MKIRRRQALLIVSLLVIVSAAVYALRPKKPEDNEKNAVLVDGLSEEFPNPEFISKAREFLEEAGYVVEYFNASSVTVPFYEGLASEGYDLIILRIHSAPMDRDKPGSALFTSEKPRTYGYSIEQLAGWVRVARTLTLEERFYAVTPDFFRDKIEGEFDDTIIICMSCYGFRDSSLAEIFIEKGAQAFVGWTELVGADHMDEASFVLLEKFLVEGWSIADSANYAGEVVGDDPIYGSSLSYQVKSASS